MPCMVKSHHSRTDVFACSCPISTQVVLSSLTGAAVDAFVNNDDDPATRMPWCNGPCALGNITNWKWSTTTSPSRSRVVGE